MKQDEHLLQCACVQWFAYQWPQYDGLLFAVPNGGARSKATAGKLKAEGVTAGVADLLLLIPSQGFHGLAIEMKTEDGRQSPAQKAWQAKVEAMGYKYVVVRSLEQFISEINDYLCKRNTNNNKNGRT